MDNHLDELKHVELNSEERVKTLGLHWLPKEDDIEIKINKTLSLATDFMKRLASSSIAKVFDPLV